MKLIDLLAEAGSEVADHDRGRFGEIRAAVEALVGENEKLKERLARAEEKGAQLKQQLAELRAPGSFVECRGALLKRSASGGFEPDAYCFECKVPMVSLSKVLPFQCPRCRASVNFSARDLTGIVAKLSRGQRAGS